MVYTEPEYDRHELNLLIAYEQSLREYNRFGIPLSEAMDPKNQFNYRSPDSPMADWSEVAHDHATRAYYATDDPEHPMPRNAHHWGPPKLIRDNSTE